jgi:hypothetical protein
MGKKKKNPDRDLDRKKWAEDLMGRYGQLQEMIDNAPISGIECKPDNTDIFLPMQQRVFAKTVGLDLVEVKPMSAPTGMLFYMDPAMPLTDEEQIERDAEKWMRENIEWIQIKIK